MDFRLRRLYEAAHAGDVYSLNELLEEDNLLLDMVVTTNEVNNNPLHIAATLGHAGFVREILRRKPKLAREFNSQHMSPLHLAAAQGHLQVAEELLQLNVDLCYLQDKDGYLPVHIAVIKGRRDLVSLLVGRCEDSVNMLTCFAETLLHLAVKSKNSEIVEHLTASSVTHLVLNAKDGNGNTCLHLAFAGRQPKVIKHLLSQADIYVNLVNSAGLTPLDVLLVTNHEMGDLYLGEKLRAAGGKTAKELSASEINIIEYSSSIKTHNTPQDILPSTPNNQITRTRSKTNKTSKNIDQNLIVVATLVATVTFAAALNPPGGVIQMPFVDSDRKNPKWFTNWENMDTVYPAGSPVYLWKLRKFFIYDYLALFTSVTVIILCLPGVIPRNNLTWKLLVLALCSSIFFMLLAFTSALDILLYREKKSTKFGWVLFDIWKYFFGVLTATKLSEIIIYLIKKVADRVTEWLRPSCMNYHWVAKVKQVIKWDKFKRTVSFLLGLAISFFVAYGIGWAMKEMVNSSLS